MNLRFLGASAEWLLCGRRRDPCGCEREERRVVRGCCQAGGCRRGRRRQRIGCCLGCWDGGRRDEIVGGVASRRVRPGAAADLPHWKTILLPARALSRNSTCRFQRKPKIRLTSPDNRGGHTQHIHALANSREPPRGSLFRSTFGAAHAPRGPPDNPS